MGEKLNIINIVIYRPPGTKGKNFSEILGKVKEILRKVKTPEPTVVLTGDFNFSFVEWIKGKQEGCEWNKKKNTGATREDQRQLESLSEQMDELGLVQVVDEPTRGENTLDLIYTNETSMIMNVESIKSSLSDHDRIEITTNIKTKKDDESEKGKKENDMGMRKLNYTDENVEWGKIRKELEEVQWKEIFNGKDVKTCLNIFLKIIMELCNKYIPMKKTRNKNIIPKKRKQLFQKIKLLRRSKAKANKKRRKEIDNKILEAEKEIINHKREERRRKEKMVIENMNKKPKFFHDFIKNKENRENKLGPFKVEGQYIRSNKEICNTMTKQYNAQYSNNNNKHKMNDKLFDNIQENDITDITIGEDDIRTAIGDIDPNSM